MKTLNYKEAAQFLKITEGTLRNWVYKKRINPHKLGKHVLFFQEELETWIKTQSFTPPNAPPVRAQNSAPTPETYDPTFTVTFCNKKAKKPYAIIESLPTKRTKMTQQEMLQLAKNLINAANYCVDPTYQGLKNHRFLRESPKDLSTPIIIPHDIMKDLKSFSDASKRANYQFPNMSVRAQNLAPNACALEFIKHGLKTNLSALNKKLKEIGKRAIHLIVNR